MTVSTREKILVGALIATIIIAAAVILVATYRIPTVGRIKAIGVEVFWDENATQTVTSIDWGFMSPGDLAGVSVYMKNTKNTNFTLSVNATNWVPIEAEQYLILDWNYTGEVIHPQEVLLVQMTLYAQMNITGIDGFSFDINIYATEPK